MTLFCVLLRRILSFCQQKTKNVISHVYRAIMVLNLSMKTSVAKLPGSCFCSAVVCGCHTAAQTLTLGGGLVFLSESVGCHTPKEPHSAPRCGTRVLWSLTRAL